MSKINYQALREAAEKALHGEWGHEAGAIWNTCDSGYVQHMAAVEAGDDVSDEEHMSNMRFITLATPTVVLGLLDELSEAKAAEENESSCANSVIDIAINWQMRAKDAEAKLEAAEKRIAELEAREIKPAKGEVLVVVSGFTGCGKSAIAGEIEIAMKAIGVPVQWTNGDAEKRMTGADWLTAIEMYKPTVRIVEVNVPRAAGIRIKGGE
ncbi:ead/Ea22-like family protein [Salmonella enterica subsp. enterica serovar Derby]|uniref:Ead/Ea22-like family protein n=3 Tax=Enterobacteriaceae TaxID=543 RepID=A0A5Z6IQ11_SALET|nr:MULTISPECIES: ead/Ea22-like family protein [Enterobacteriaceae]EAC1335997.1 ead/Ea22-like family protein [Salmonella enterica subsp. enterica serovar Typhimurium]EBC9741878.1 ead/Ea22-like family protein [Salmonella enterica subsp. enterica serovar Infantis]EBE0761053.1 ead/Ea22-like family protein [Salmonella enterica subsp. enterica serovar Eko]EBE8988439.1 ead/Ea22-like family protein [Salmonella enterica subsp. enterica serovar Chailey]EBF8696360.1 ead/Ea22-like family protein [Salmonel